MDPDANLAELRALAERIQADADAGPDAPLACNPSDGIRLAELAIALDRWIARGGFYPRAWTRQPDETIERMIDAHGLAATIDNLAAIAHAKAEHIDHAWQDRSLAGRWTRAAGILETARQRITSTPTDRSIFEK